MFKFLNYILISPNIEIVCLLILGTLFQMADGSPFQITKKLDAVWSTDLPREYFSPIVQQMIKTGLSIIVAARCGATYPYAMTAMLVVFCLLKDRAPKLMLPWIFVAAVKSVGMTFVEALIGVYVCSAFGKIHKACIEFLISKAVEIIFAAYLWGSVLSVYQDMERRLEHERIIQNSEIAFIKKMDLKRKRARSLLDEATLYKTACLNNFEFKDVPQIILQMLRRANEMSQDSLLGPGMMLASVSNMGSFDNLKKSESLGELGYTNLQTTKVIGLDEEENLSPPEKALKFLKMTRSDVKRIQHSVNYGDKDTSALHSDSWFHVTISDAQIYKPKQARTEVYIRELPEVEADEDNRFKGKNMKKMNIKLGISLFNLIKKNTFDNCEEESFADSHEEAEEEEEEEEEEKADEELSKIFMSNIKDEKPVNRIGLNIGQEQHKGTAYYKLYRKDFMSVIGPEVFEKATKLRKVTSFTLPKLMSKTPPRNSAASNSNSQSDTSGGNLSEKNEDFRENVGISPGVQQMGEIQTKLKSAEIKKCESETKSCLAGDKEKLPSGLKTQPSREEVVEVQKTRPLCYKNRRIRIKWIGSLKDNFKNCISTSSGFSVDDGDSSDCQDTPEKGSDKSITPEQMKISFSNSITSFEKKDKSNEKYIWDEEVHFLIKLLHKPLPEVLGKYNDLKDVVCKRRKSSAMYKKEFDHTENLYGMYFLKRFGEMRETGGKDYKVWKSKVLKIAGASWEPITGNFLNKIDQDVVNKLLRYQYLFLMNKTEENSNVSTTSLQIDAENRNNGEQSLIQLSASKSRNELCCRSHSANVVHSREILKEDNNNIIYSNKGNFSETPSEHSLEVCRKDLNNGQLYSSEQAQGPAEDYSKDEFKNSEEFLENAEDGSLYSQESDEPISLYYSKAANLASPLLDMKKFIYPDHIHYSYKHVNKRGFDVNISGDLPLLVQRQALVKNKNLHVKKILAKPEPEITKRPMDLSFAKTNAFADWQNSDQNVSDPPAQSNANSNEIKGKPSSEETSKRKKGKRSKKKGKSSERNSRQGTSLDSYHVYFTHTSAICKKLLTESNERDVGRTPVRISSTQLHSNKGRISSTYNPALRLQENKKEGKKKAEAQEKHAKDMLARLEKEIFFPKQKWL